jgi:putative spermidine/putrescine transport system ATP-binding protein
MLEQTQHETRRKREAAPGSAHEILCTFMDVKKTYDGKSWALAGLNLEIRSGEFLTCLGPSGSGKTTALMLLAGFQTQSSGEICFRGRPLSKVAPHQRNFGVVFQSYALFPHMTVAENILFPLKMRGMARDKAEGKLNRALDMIRMKAFALRKPAELSGGQQQRVALARALVFDPDLLLLDEPLAALDKSLREELQYELRSLHEQLGVTMLYVTHDQGEALTLSDRIAVFRNGKIEQLAAPAELYNQPATRFVASFICDTNFIPATVVEACGNAVTVRTAEGNELRTVAVVDLAVGDLCALAIRPEKICLRPSGDIDCRLPVQVRDLIFHGSALKALVITGSGTRIWMLLRPEDNGRLSPGETVEIGWHENSGRCFFRSE